jgi:hypothetical protein
LLDEDAKLVVAAQGRSYKGQTNYNSVVPPEGAAPTQDTSKVVADVTAAFSSIVESLRAEVAELKAAQGKPADSGDLVGDGAETVPPKTTTKADK